MEKVNLDEIFQHIIDTSEIRAMPNLYCIGNGNSFNDSRLFLIMRDERGKIQSVKYKNRNTYVDFTNIIAKNMDFMLASKYKTNIANIIKNLPYVYIERTRKIFSDEYILKSNGITIKYEKATRGRRVTFSDFSIFSQICGNKTFTGQSATELARLCEKKVQELKSKRTR